MRQRPPLAARGANMTDQPDYETQVSEEAGILRVVVQGVRDFGRTRRLVALVRNSAKERGVQRVLLDTRALANAPSNNERFALGELVAEEWRGLRVAVINPGEARDGFVETVAINRGAMMRAFETEHGALEWLQVG
jgi:hypothetical protein